MGALNLLKHIVMYYRIKVWSKEDCSKKEIYYIKDNVAPYVVIECLEQFYKMATKYQVKITALPPNVTKLKKKYKVWDTIELEKHIRELRFYNIKKRETDEYAYIETFYKEKPFDIETEFFNGNWYTFFKRPGKYTTDIYKTLKEIVDKVAWLNGTQVKRSINGDPFIVGKFSLSYAMNNHITLGILTGKTVEFIKEELCS